MSLLFDIIMYILYLMDLTRTLLLKYVSGAYILTIIIVKMRYFDDNNLDTEGRKVESLLQEQR